MRIARSACLIAFLSFIFVSIPLCIAQEGTSLGDVARKLREQRSGATATAPVSQSPVQPQSKETPATIQVVAGPVIEKSVETYQENISNLLAARNYQEIDRIATAARASKARLRGGYWELHILYAALDFPIKPDRDDGDFEARIGRMKEWMAQRSNPEFESMDWPRIKRGYLVQRELYGDAGYSVSQMARIAANRDWQLSDELFTKLNGERDPKVWPSQEEYEQFRLNASRYAGAEKTNEALKLAESNLMTKDGRDYSDQLARTFAHDYSFVVQQCAFSTGSSTYAPFQMAVRIGKSGAVEKVYSTLTSNMSQCMTEKLQKGNFPAPPQPSYWATVSLK